MVALRVQPPKLDHQLQRVGIRGLNGDAQDALQDALEELPCGGPLILAALFESLRQLEGDLDRVPELDKDPGPKLVPFEVV